MPQLSSLKCPRCGAVAPEHDQFCETCGLRLVPNASQIQGPAAIGADVAIVTDIGKRHARNEDAGAIARGMVDGQSAYALVVCDGVSSSSNADQLAACAATAAQAALIEALRGGPFGDPESVVDVIRTAHRAACALDLESEPGKDLPGAAIVAAIAWPVCIRVGWLGDSRAYWVTEGEAVALTEDDSVSAGSHEITHCIGPLEDVETLLAPHSLSLDPTTAGRLVLCSDGFWNYAPDEAAVNAVVRSAPADADAETLARWLVQFALDRGGMDNVTVAVARLESKSKGVG